MQTEHTDRILRLKAVIDMTGLARTTLYRRMQEGTFPKSVQISVRCVGWRESAIREWSQSPMSYAAKGGARSKLNRSPRPD
jgi:prophage regulatory protein